MRVCIGVRVLNVLFAAFAGTASSGCGALSPKECVEWYGKAAENEERRFFKALSCVGKPDVLLCDSDKPLPNEECQ